MIKDCIRCLPNEACGLLSGNGPIGDTLWILTNETHHPNRFHMSTEAIREAVFGMETIDEELSGIFHSHPSSPPFPSLRDIKKNPYTDIAYLIVSLHKGEINVGCFRMDDEKVIPLQLIVVEE